MTDFERPPADPQGIVDAWAAWTSDDELPGRTMADLKIAGLDLALVVLSENNETVSSLLTHWTAWEKAKVTPVEALASLTEGGLGAVIEAIAQTAE